MSSSSTDSLLSVHEQSVALLSNMEARAEHQKIKHYQSLYSITTSIGVGLLILVLTWLIHFRGGFAWQSNPSLEFNWHPFLMVLGLVFLYSQSILVYRTLRSSPKRRLKIIHALLHICAFILAVIGLKAVFDSHNLAANPIPNLYTLHSWLGLLTVIIFAGQFLFGFITFLYPGMRKTIRQSFLPVHTAIGTAGFVLAISTTLMGVLEKAIWTLKSDYQQLTSESILVNVIGLFAVIYGILVLYMVNEYDYKRIAIPEDEIALVEE